MKFFFLLLSALTFYTVINAQDSLQEYTGKYVFPDGSVVPDVEVTLSGNALTMSSVTGTSSLVQLGVDSFLIVEYSGTSVFKRGEDKKINAVHIEAMGYVLDGKKQEGGSWSFTVALLPSRELLTTKK